MLQAPVHHEVWLRGVNGHGSTDTKIRRFDVQVVNAGTAISYATTAEHGSVFTINEDGLYSITYCDRSWSAQDIGVSVGSTQLTTAINGITDADRVAYAYANVDAANVSLVNATAVAWLNAGQVVRPHTSGSGAVADLFLAFFRILKVR